MPVMFPGPTKSSFRISKDIAFYCYKDGIGSTVACNGDVYIQRNDDGKWVVALFHHAAGEPVHNLTGPAVTYVDGTFEWFIDGERLTKVQWLEKKPF